MLHGGGNTSVKILEKNIVGVCLVFWLFYLPLFYCGILKPRPASGKQYGGNAGTWTEEVLAARAKSYGLTTDEYKKNNILKTVITSADVAELAIELCGSLFAKTTGAQIPVDGGNERVI